MGIDGIGKPPGANIGGVGGLQGTDAPRPAEAFSLNASTAAAPASRVSAALSSLQRGELSLDQYLDGRVSEATQHLAGKISPDQLEFVKQSLRDQLATDPVLVELVQRTTGAAPASELR
ncbi:MAG: hypothetical protein ABJB12_07625 [Pseudomonadota bacterium]